MYESVAAVRRAPSLVDKIQHGRLIYGQSVSQSVSTAWGASPGLKLKPLFVDDGTSLV